MPQPPILYPLGFTPGQFLQAQLPPFATSNTKLTTTLLNPVQAGSLLIACICSFGALSVTDSVGGEVGNTYNTLSGISPFSGTSPNVAASGSQTCNTWIPLPALVVGGLPTTQMWYVPSNSRSGILSVTATFVSGTSELAVLEYVGGGQFLNQVTATATSTGPAQVAPSIPYAPSISPAGFTNSVLTVNITRIASAQINGVNAGTTQRGNDQNFMGVGDIALQVPGAVGAVTPGFTMALSAQWSSLSASFYVPSLMGFPA